MELNDQERQSICNNQTAKADRTIQLEAEVKKLKQEVNKINLGSLQKEEREEEQKIWQGLLSITIMLIVFVYRSYNRTPPVPISSPDGKFYR